MSAPTTPDDPQGLCTCEDPHSLRCPKHGELPVVNTAIADFHNHMVEKYGTGEGE